MGIFTKDIKTMDDLLLHGLQDIYYAEQQITKALPKMIDKATNRDLATGLKTHLEETNKQIERLDKVFQKLGKQPSGTNVPPSTASSAKPMRSPARSRTRRCWTPRWCPAHRPSSITRLPLRHLDRVGRSARPRRIVRFLTTNLNEEKATNTKFTTMPCARASMRRPPTLPRQHRRALVTIRPTSTDRAIANAVASSPRRSWRRPPGC